MKGPSKCTRRASRSSRTDTSPSPRCGSCTASSRCAGKTSKLPEKSWCVPFVLPCSSHATCDCYIFHLTSPLYPSSFYTIFFHTICSTPSFHNIFARPSTLSLIHHLHLPTHLSHLSPFTTSLIFHPHSFIHSSPSSYSSSSYLLLTLPPNLFTPPFHSRAQPLACAPKRSSSTPTSPWNSSSSRLTASGPSMKSSSTSNPPTATPGSWSVSGNCTFAMIICTRYSYSA